MEKNYLGHDIKKLGFGLMRLPMDGEKIDIEHTNRMIDKFLANGFTYFDTAYFYINHQSETAVKECLVSRYPRESFQLATKMPIYLVKEPGDCQRYFDEQLERTGAEYFDYYLLHGLGRDTAKIADEQGGWEFLVEQKAKGLVKNIGFSFHDSAEFLDELLTKHPEVEFVQLQINYADWDDVRIQSRACYEVAMKHNVPIIIMEPVKGGSLAQLHESVAEVLKTADPSASAASWALRFCASLDGVITILSGMSNMEQMEDNIATLKTVVPLSDAEQSVVAAAMSKLREFAQVPCTDCKYCMEKCPQNINISGIFRAFNHYKMYDNKGHFQWHYADVTRDAGKASQCISCGVCEGRCPQHIGIMKQLTEIVPFAE